MIDWSKVPEEFKYAAMDASGDFYVFTHRPFMGKTEWYCTGGDMVFYKPLPDWERSLEVRPEGENK